MRRTPQKQQHFVEEASTFREAHAVWRDGPYTGKGTVSTPSAVLHHSRYLFGLPETIGSTTPGELLAAAVASSMSTAVAMKMARCGARSSAVETRAVVTVDDPGEAWRLCALRLEIIAQMLEPTTDRVFLEAVAEARRGCPIVSVLNLDVTCTATLIRLEVPITAAWPV